MNIVEQLKETLIEEIKQAIVKAELVTEVPPIKIEVPKDTTNGDYASNIAMVLTKIAKKNPRDIATLIVEHLNTSKAHVEKIEIAGPGFINFYMDNSYLTDIINQVRKEGSSYGYQKNTKNKKVLVEFVSANPTGDLHIGHARNAAVGDTLANVLQAAGYEVAREYYINDAGKQIENLAYSIEARYLQALNIESTLPADGYHGKDIINIGKELAKQHPEYKDISSEERIKMFRQLGLDYEMKKLKQDLSDFNVHFDNWFSETSLYETGAIDKALKTMKDNNYVYTEDGATWLRTTDFGDDKDRVLIKQDGTYTYFLPDVAYHYDKLQRGNDTLINLFGADHHGYIARLKASLETLGYDSKKLEIQIMQMVRLLQDGQEVKMSKRTGNAITLKDIMDEVGVDAARYFLTMRSADTHFDFDMELAKSESSDNPVYYAQYAHARISSIIKSAKEQGYDLVGDANFSLITNDKAYELLKRVADFQSTIESAALARAPHRIPHSL